MLRTLNFDYSMSDSEGRESSDKNAESVLYY
jgi:hypothetical protein